MKKILLQWLCLVLWLYSNVVNAAPKQVDLTYEVIRNGQPFATVTETYRQENGRYKIESVTTGIGVYALFGKRILTSEGEVTAGGLKPGHFELHQGDNEKKSLFTDFDWEGNTLNMKVKGKPRTVVLEKGTQDLASFSYQFMFFPPSADEFKLPVTTGKKLNVYQYRVTEKEVKQELAAGKFTTIHLVNADKGSEDGKELWLGVECHYLPVRISMRDENGAKIEQALTSWHAK